ncbi:MAG: hypothetical protein HDR04_14360 [Lachnospiraceae bacterium]|nr:hypothetical protein [Lachnospiraceae bacterium]
MSGKENNINAPEENNMRLSEALNMLIDVRNACKTLGLHEHATALETVYAWVDKVLTDSNSL